MLSYSHQSRKFLFKYFKQSLKIGENVESHISQVATLRYVELKCSSCLSLHEFWRWWAKFHVNVYPVHFLCIFQCKMSQNDSCIYQSKNNTMDILEDFSLSAHSKEKWAYIKFYSQLYGTRYTYIHFTNTQTHNKWRHKETWASSQSMNPGYFFSPHNYLFLSTFPYT